MISIRDISGERINISSAEILSVREMFDSFASVVGFKTAITLSNGHTIKTNESSSSIIERVLNWQFKWESYRALARAWAEHVVSFDAQDLAKSESLRNLMNKLEEELKNLALK